MCHPDVVGPVLRVKTKALAGVSACSHGAGHLGMYSNSGLVQAEGQAAPHGCRLELRSINSESPNCIPAIHVSSMVFHDLFLSTLAHLIVAGSAFRIVSHYTMIQR
jgi:hypothetical protein